MVAFIYDYNESEALDIPANALEPATAGRGGEGAVVNARSRASPEMDLT